MQNAGCAGKPVRHLGLPGEMLVLSIGRDGELIIPHGSTRLEMGDRLTILGNQDTLDETAGWLEKSE